MLLQASRNGYFFVLDRTNGKSLLTSTFAAVNWSKGVDKDGVPFTIPKKTLRGMVAWLRRMRAERRIIVRLVSM